ncbi:MAG: SNF2-related protein [Propionibacteriaceae bacterium]
MVGWSELLTDAAISRAVGHEAFARGFVYARTGHVLHLELDDAELAIHALVSGSSREPYRTRVYLKTTPGGSAGQHEGYCDCPITVNCKHAAAVMLATRTRLAGQPPPTRPVWERTLGRLVSTPIAPPGPPTPLGLQLELGDRGGDRLGLTLRARPVRRGRSGRWVQTGVSWGDLHYDYGHRYDPDQRAWLLRLQSTVPASARSVSGWPPGSELALSAAGAGLWRVLQDAGEIGVAVTLTGHAVSSIRLATAAVEVVLDLRQTDLTGRLELAPVVAVEGRSVELAQLGVIGDPGHGIAARLGRGPGAELVLAPLRTPLTRELHDWLVGGEPVVIPATDRDRFFDDYYPALRQRTTLASTDGSVTFPAAARPTLHLQVQHRSVGLLDLSWSASYPSSAPTADRGRRRFPLAPGGLGAVALGAGTRDLAAEAELLADLPLPYDRFPVLAERRAAERHGTVRGATGRDRPVATAQLTGVDAADFASQVVPRLLAHGVEVESTGEPVDYRRLESPPLITVSALERSAGSDWFDLVVDVSIDGELVPFDQLFAALASGADQLVLDSGVYFTLDRPEFGRLVELITEARSLQDRDRSQLRINRHHVGLWDELVALGVVDQQAERWVAVAAAVAGLESPAEVDPPAGLRAELRPYQLEGYAWLWSLWRAGVGGILADDMGLGKTLQALALIGKVRESDGAESRPPFLVVAPTSVLSTWAGEAARFAPDLEVVTVERSVGKAGTPLAERVAGADIVLTSYALLRIDVEHWSSAPWRGLILDEAQFVKNHQAKTYAAVRRLGAEFVVAMSGTPLENSLMDLWSLLSITAPGMFPSPQRFAGFYARPVERGTEPGRLVHLRHRIRPLMLRRTKEVVAAELPAKQEQVLTVELHPRHARLYQTHLQRERQKVLGLIEAYDEHRFSVLASLTLLRQLSLDAALVDDRYTGVPSAKVELLVQRLGELVAEGHRALVFSQFTGFLGRLAARLEGTVPVSYLDGGTHDRGAVIEGFQTGPPGAFLISLKAGGFGLNLTEADYVFVCDPWWNPAAEAQAVDRAHRIGQTQPVMVYRLIAADTIEAKVMVLKERKLRLYDAVMGVDALPAGTLSAGEIIDLLGS